MPSQHEKYKQNIELNYNTFLFTGDMWLIYKMVTWTIDNKRSRGVMLVQFSALGVVVQVVVYLYSCLVATYIRTDRHLKSIS